MIRDTLLIIDDCELDLIILKEIFKDSFLVECVSSAQQGLTFLHKNRERVCAILLDIYLERPGEGVHVLSRLQMDPATSVFPVVLITSDANEKTVRASVKLGAVDLLAKPVNPLTVRERVCSLIKTAWPSNSTILDCKPDFLSQKSLSTQQDKADFDQQTSILKEAQDVFETWSYKFESFCRLRQGMDIETHRQLGVITTLLAKRYVELFPNKGLTQEEAVLIGLASVFCDIGLLGIPDYIVTEDENRNGTDAYLYYQHTQLGYELLTLEEHNYPLFSYAAEIALWHHKNVDGSGYPLDTDVSDIPISAQLTRAALRVQHYLYYYRGYPDSIERMLRSLRDETEVVFGPDLYQVIEQESKTFQSMINSITNSEKQEKEQI